MKSDDKHHDAAQIFLGICERKKSSGVRKNDKGSLAVYSLIMQTDVLQSLILTDAGRRMQVGNNRMQTPMEKIIKTWRHHFAFL